MLSDLACAIADGAEALSDFRVMGDQAELFGPVASVPTAWRTLQEIAGGGARPADRIATVVAAHSDKVGAEANFKGYDPTGDIHAGDEQTHRAGRSRVLQAFPGAMASANLVTWIHPISRLAGVAMVDFRVVPECTALVNVDLQNFFVENAPEGLAMVERVNPLAAGAAGHALRSDSSSAPYAVSEGE